MTLNEIEALAMAAVADDTGAEPLLDFMAEVTPERVLALIACVRAAVAYFDYGRRDYDFDAALRALEELPHG